MHEEPAGSDELCALGVWFRALGAFDVDLLAESWSSSMANCEYITSHAAPAGWPSKRRNVPGRRATRAKELRAFILLGSLAAYADFSLNRVSIGSS